jgi:tetratricopeptide (TPR) repeat protein
VPLFARPDRVKVYRGSWYLIQDFPFTGIGLGGTFAMMYSRYVLLIQVPFLTYSHNLFLQVWLNHGLLGITAFAWMIAAFSVLVWRAGRRSGALFQGAWLGVTAILLHGLSDARQYADGWTIPPLFALMGLAVASGAESVKVQTQGRSLAWKLVGATAAGILATTLALAWQPLTAKAYANAGALSQARAELTENLTDAQRSILLKRAADYYDRAITFDQCNRTANQRLGVLAMDAQQLSDAVAYLEAAYQADPTNTTTHKALGLTYTWAGHLDQAERLLVDVPDIVEELNVWGWWWGTQGKYEWATNAYRVSLLLNPEQPSIQEALASVLED